MSGVFALFLLSLSSIEVLSQSSNGCEIGLNRDLLPKVDPVLFLRNASGHLDFMTPVNSGADDYIRLSKGQEMVLACPGSGNVIVPTNSPVSSSICSSGQTVIINRETYNIRDLVCKTKTTATLLNTQKACAGTAFTVQIGYNVENWNYLVETCYSISNAATYYAMHNILGSNLAGKVKMDYRPDFATGGSTYYPKFSPDDCYAQNAQLPRFQTLVGPNSAAKYIQISKLFYLSRGHLAPDADFIYSSWRMLTYFYINAAPQWQVINQGSWLSVENTLRTKAQNVGANLEVVTGTFGVLKLLSDSNKLVPITLESTGKLPVPELFWKVARNPNDNSCIVFISTNNPFLTAPPSTICPDVCKANRWPVLQSNLSKGYVYCCDYNKFRSVVTKYGLSYGYVPSLTCNSIMKF